MPTQRISLLLPLCISVLLSCNNKRKSSTAYDTILGSLDTAFVQSYEKPNIGDYAEAFTASIIQRFTLPSNRVSIVKGKKGLIITVNPSVLEKENGDPVNGKIDVSMIELTNTDELFKANAGTMSNGNLLASGGSYYIGMACYGQKLRIKRGESLQMQFPQIKQNEMELFYGQRNISGMLNWMPAGIGLQSQKEKDAMFTDSSRFNETNNLPSFALDEKHEVKLYKTLYEQVYYYEKKMTIKDIVDTINRHSAKIYIDTIYAWPKGLKDLPPGTRVDTNFLNHVYGPRQQYIIKAYRNVEAEKKKLAKQKAMQESALAKWKPKSLAGQLQKYYSPSPITTLGWINCDRFYQPAEMTDMEVNIPISLNDSHIEYFLIYKSINGLMNISMDSSSQRKAFYNLPIGQPVTLIGFAKNKGELFQCKEEFVIQKNKTLQLHFENISAEEMTMMFGKNVRI